MPPLSLSPVVTSSTLSELGALPLHPYSLHVPLLQPLVLCILQLVSPCFPVFGAQVLSELTNIKFSRIFQRDPEEVDQERGER